MTYHIFKLQSGVEVTITPLTPMGQAHFLKQALELCPDPDPTPYEKPLPDALVEGDKIAATNDPEYVRLLKAAQARRSFVHQNLLLDAMADIEDRETVLHRHCKVIENTRGAVVNIGSKAEPLYAEIEPDFVRLLYVSLALPSEIAEIVKLIVRLTPLEPGEVIEGLKFFRGVGLQRRTAD